MISEAKIGQNGASLTLMTVLYHISFLLLCVSAVIFYEERLYGDSGAYIFDVINTRSFWVMNNRYILAVSQVFAVIAVWLHLPLKAVLIVYSLGHVLFFYFLFLIGHYGLKLKWSGPLFLVLQTLGVNFTYFAWPYGEIPYGIGVVMLMAMMIIALPKLKVWHMAVMVVLVFLAVTSHPFIIILAGLALAMLFLNAEYRGKVLTTGLMLAAVFAIKLLVFPSYMGDLVGQRMEEGISFGFNMNEVRGMIRIHKILFYSLVALCILQLYRRRWWWFLFVIPSSFMILFVIKQYFPLDGATQQYYISFTGILILTLMIDYFNRKPLFGLPQVNSIALPVILLGLTVWSYFPILEISKEFSDRVDKINLQLDQCRELDGQQFIVNGYNYFKSEENIWMESEIRIESLLLGCQDAQIRKPVVLYLFERASEQIEFLETNTTEFASPSTPGSKTKRYPVTAQTQAELADKMVNFDFIGNAEYFPIVDDTCKFLNRFKTNSDSTLLEILSISLNSIQNRGHNTYRIGMQIKTIPETSAYSGEQNGLLVGFHHVERDDRADTMLAAFPVMADIEGSHLEFVRIDFMPYDLVDGDKFMLSIFREDRTYAVSPRFSYMGK